MLIGWSALFLAHGPRRLYSIFTAPGKSSSGGGATSTGSKGKEIMGEEPPEVRPASLGPSSALQEVIFVAILAASTRGPDVRTKFAFISKISIGSGGRLTLHMSTT
mmetsp:Transcript_130739/g.279626  ORF Transcript_130739/g.279626 Transcript_130739/m.279626 type:complete len:106 (-) Transcript_130739:1895-2212(-)